jgi:hypothetical protein
MSLKDNAFIMLTPEEIRRVFDAGKRSNPNELVTILHVIINGDVRSSEPSFISFNEVRDWIFEA